jgi:hypothetical protein
MRHRIHVPLLSNPTIYREADARAAGDGRFRLVGKRPSAEPLQFSPGEVVECSILPLPDGSKGLVAIRSVSADPEYRSRRTIYAVSGAFVGALIGAAFALSFDVSLFAFSIGAVIGATSFAFCSVRWGDSAWDVLSRFFEWP